MFRARAIIFDLDDTLVERPGRAHDAWRGALEDLPELTRRHSLDEVIHILDAARERAWSDARRRAGPVLDYAGARAALIEDAMAILGFPPRGALAASLNDAISRHQGRSNRLNAESIDVLAALRATAIPLALLTNGESRSQRGKIERFALESYFAHILIEEEIGAGKPFDDAYRMALTCFDCAADDIWFVGDHLENDVAGPRRHGMRTVWYNPTRMPAPDADHRRADAEIASLRELLTVLTVSPREVPA